MLLSLIYDVINIGEEEETSSNALLSSQSRIPRQIRKMLTDFHTHFVFRRTKQFM